MKITFKKSDYDLIVQHSREALPNEACGLLGGVLEQDGTHAVRRVYTLTNTDASPYHFSMSPSEQFAAVKNIRENGWKLIGNFHSHPETPARPSDEDKRLAFDASLSYLILSLSTENPVLKAFRIENGNASETEILILN
ncbi:MAG: M67 family metallopeptidase [Clostridiaceae bacterium]|jgi:proteasome lid subunit RPN8/RPN11|nr:M67 family metallopeptidase [Clostridiaceae bacterium]